jgi:polyferredoxin
MDAGTLGYFIFSPYNKVADIKTYSFFAHLTSFAFCTILILVVLSVVIQNLWRRYLCPYGALLGMLSWLSPLKITRQKSTCIDCELCTKACPAAFFSGSRPGRPRVRRSDFPAPSCFSPRSSLS